MATPRAVRIPRPSRSEPPTGPGPAPVAPDAAAATEGGPDIGAAIESAPDVRANDAARRRARRLVLIYLLPLLAMYLGFLELDRLAPGGSSVFGSIGTLVFTGLFAVLALAGVLLTLAPVPRAVEVGPAAVVVVEWTGRRRTFPPLPDLRVEVVHRYPAGVLSDASVVTVELTGGKRRRTYHLTDGLLPEQRPGRTRADR
ncbi:MAG TPA: hypothetical protein VMG14_05935 [Thermoplasmata archaeon]|nr:hypothetical protein [Thermoplasmata archaeon]